MKNIFLLLASSALLMTCTPKGVRIYTLHQTYADSRISITFDDCNETELMFNLLVLKDELESRYDEFDFHFNGVGIIDDFEVFANGIETIIRDKNTTSYNIVIRLTVSDMNRFIDENCSLDIWDISFLL